LESSPQFAELYKQALDVLNSESRIPTVSRRGKWLYNLWNDPTHPRGLYRKTTLSEFHKTNPNWETVLDIDELSKKEEKPWVFQDMRCLPDAYSKCLVFLSPGGADASEVREFNMDTLSFVRHGYFISAAKTEASWIDDNHIFVSTDFGPGSLTQAGFGRIVKIWKRNTKLLDAKTVLEIDPRSIQASAYRIRTASGNIDLALETVSTWSTHVYQIIDGQLSKLDLPDTATIEGGYFGQLVITLDEDWTIGGKKFQEGSVVLVSPEILHGGKGKIDLLIAPTQNEIVDRVVSGKNSILVSTLRNVEGHLYQYYRNGNHWMNQSVLFPEKGTIRVTSVNDENGDFFVRYESFITPPTLYFVSSETLKPEKVKAQNATFDSSQFEVSQFWTQSEDDTRVPYFVVRKKGTIFNGENPTRIFSYGGFRISLTPSYSGSYEELSGAYGKLWLERGGVFVLANIRGGGEFGPAWHKAALRENRVKAYQDFEAVVQDLFKRKITSPHHLGIEGRSNGGLLVMALMVRHPEYYGAIVCGSPLIDLYRYDKLLEGAYWTSELGDADNPNDWKFMKTFSPYQNVKPGQKYPPVFFYASTRDDRVHPGHARKMVAKMIEMGYPDTLYFENVEGGHHASSTNEQLAYRLGLAYTHLWKHLANQ
jgi:prolyl oligopeptidase